MRRLAILALLALGGCESAQTRATNLYVNCMARGIERGNLTEDERAFLVQGCAELYDLEVGK